MTILLQIILFMITPSYAQFGKEWLVCKTNDDCTKVSGICGRNDSINKKFIKDFELFATKMAAVSSCTELTEEEKKYNQVSIVECAAGQCKLIAPKK